MDGCFFFRVGLHHYVEGLGGGGGEFIGLGARETSPLVWWLLLHKKDFPSSKLLTGYNVFIWGGRGINVLPAKCSPGPLLYPVVVPSASGSSLSPHSHRGSAFPSRT